MENEKALFEEIFRKNQDRVYRLCCMYSEDADLRKDLMQDIFIKVWENLNSFRGEAAMSTWIYRIALNTCLTHVRTIRRSLKVNSLPDKFDIADSNAGFDEEQNLDFFIHSVNQLPSFDRTLISLYLEDLSGKEIAEITGLSEANVRVKIHRIKERLGEMIKELTINKVNHEF
jgi:RNA polymerase sigma factor (sigma-70 family)